MIIRKIELFRVTFPLKKPYYLSYGPISILKSLLARVTINENRIGLGESTPLYGYSDFDIDDVVKIGRRLAKKWIGHNCQQILSNPPIGMDGFLFTALFTALEEAVGIIPPAHGAVPVVGLTQESTDEYPCPAIERVRAEGYQVFKIKVGFCGSDADKKRVQEYQNALLPGEKIRIDANQSLSTREAHSLVEICDPEKVEVFEQPYPVAWWKQTAVLRKISPVPIMLDESVTDIDSIRYAAESRAADVVKLKWMKQGGFSLLKQMTNEAQRLGLKVIIGNGVASSLNNRKEAVFWLSCLRDSGLAGEMNGFIKLKDSVRSNFIKFQNGCVIVSKVDPKIRHRFLDDMQVKKILTLCE